MDKIGQRDANGKEVEASSTVRLLNGCETLCRFDAFITRRTSSIHLVKMQKMLTERTESVANGSETGQDMKITFETNVLLSGCFTKPSSQLNTVDQRHRHLIRTIMGKTITAINKARATTTNM